MHSLERLCQNSHSSNKQLIQGGVTFKTDKAETNQSGDVVTCMKYKAFRLLTDIEMTMFRTVSVFWIVTAQVHQLCEWI